MGLWSGSSSSNRKGPTFKRIGDAKVTRSKRGTHIRITLTRAQAAEAGLEAPGTVSISRARRGKTLKITRR